MQYLQELWHVKNVSQVLDARRKDMICIVCYQPGAQVQAVLKRALTAPGCSNRQTLYKMLLQTLQRKCPRLAIKLLTSAGMLCSCALSASMLCIQHYRYSSGSRACSKQLQKSNSRCSEASHVGADPTALTAHALLYTSNQQHICCVKDLHQ